MGLGPGKAGFQFKRMIPENPNAVSVAGAAGVVPSVTESRVEDFRYTERMPPFAIAVFQIEVPGGRASTVPVNVNVYNAPDGNVAIPGVVTVHEKQVPIGVETTETGPICGGPEALAMVTPVGTVS